MFRGGAHEVIAIPDANHEVSARFFRNVKAAGLELLWRRKVPLDAQGAVRYFG